MRETQTLMAANVNNSFLTPRLILLSVQILWGVLQSLGWEWRFLVQSELGSDKCKSLGQNSQFTSLK